MKDSGGCGGLATFQDADVDAGHSARRFEVAEIAGEFTRLTANGVAFTRPPSEVGQVTLAVFADTCGNLIQLYQPGAAMTIASRRRGTMRSITVSSRRTPLIGRECRRRFVLPRIS